MTDVGVQPSGRLRRRGAVAAVATLLALGTAAACTSRSDLISPVPDRAAQSELNTVFTEAASFRSVHGSFGPTLSLVQYVNSTDGGVNLGPLPSVGRGGGRVSVVVAENPTGSEIELGLLSQNGHCWFIEEIVTAAPGADLLPGSAPRAGTFYGLVDSLRGANRSCAVASGPAGTGGNAFSGWTTTEYPVPHNPN